MAALTRSLVAVVHGHCHFALTGAFALMGEPDPEGAALARVREVLTAASANPALLSPPAQAGAGR